MNTLKKYLPYIIAVVMIVVGGIIRWKYKQSKHESFREQRDQSINNLKESLKNLGAGNTTARAK